MPVIFSYSAAKHTFSIIKKKKISILSFSYPSVTTKAINLNRFLKIKQINFIIMMGIYFYLYFQLEFSYTPGSNF